MPQARLTVDPQFAVGTVNRRIFGSFVEHLGRCVYDGIYEPPATSRSPTSDWPTAPRILEHRYSVLDGVVVGNLLISLLKHADRVTSASTKQPSCLQFIMHHLWVPVLGHIGDTLSSQAIAIRTRRRPDSSPLTLSVDRLAHGGAGPPRLALQGGSAGPAVVHD
jgi:hypothetical protein